VPKFEKFRAPDINAWYQHLNFPSAQGYFLGITASKLLEQGNENVTIHTESLAVEEGKTYELKDYPKKGKAFATYFTVKNFGNIHKYTTSGIHRGELHITKLDDYNQIMSGTFWFDAVDDKGEKVEVREGRFDVVFTK
jgi:hypothetical protein